MHKGLCGYADGFFFFSFFFSSTNLHEGTKAGNRQLARSTTRAWSGVRGYSSGKDLLIFGFFPERKKREVEKKTRNSSASLPYVNPEYRQAPKDRGMNSIRSEFICNIKANYDVVAPYLIITVQ